LAWSPIGDELVFDGFHDIQVWSADTGQSLRILNATVNSDVKLAFNPAENLIAFVNLDSSEPVIEIWDTDSGQFVRQLQGHTDRIIDFAWRTGGFVSTGADDTIRLWDTQTGQQLRSFQVGRYPDAELNMNGTILLVEDEATGIHTRDAETGAIVSVLGEPPPLQKNSETTSTLAETYDRILPFFVQLAVG
jgi:WD40 repeat protein